VEGLALSVIDLSSGNKYPGVCDKNNLMDNLIIRKL
jgi:hypothetical protein